MGSTKKNAIRAYIKLPRGIRKFTDPIIKNRSKTQDSFERRAEKGKQIIKNRLKKVIVGKRRKRRR